MKKRFAFKRRKRIIDTFGVRMAAFLMILFLSIPFFGYQTKPTGERADILKQYASMVPPDYEIASTFYDRIPAVLEFDRITILVLGKKGEIYKDHVQGRSASEAHLFFDGYHVMTVKRTPNGFDSKIRDLASGDIILESFFAWDVTCDLKDEIIIETYSGGSGGFGNLFIFSLRNGELITLLAEGIQGFEIIEIGEPKKSVVEIDERVGVGGGYGIWSDLYEWDGNKFIMADEKFPEFYKEMIRKYAERDDWRDRFVSGRAYEVLKMWDDAEAEYKKALEALKKDPDDWAEARIQEKLRNLPKKSNR